MRFDPVTQSYIPGPEDLYDASMSATQPIPSLYRESTGNGQIYYNDPGSLENYDRTGIPPTIRQESPYARAAYMADPYGSVRPLTGFPSAYPIVLNSGARSAAPYYGGGDLAAAQARAMQSQENFDRMLQRRWVPPQGSQQQQRSSQSSTTTQQVPTTPTTAPAAAAAPPNNTSGSDGSWLDWLTPALGAYGAYRSGRWLWDRITRPRVGEEAPRNDDDDTPAGGAGAQLLLPAGESQSQLTAESQPLLPEGPIPLPPSLPLLPAGSGSSGGVAIPEQAVAPVYAADGTPIEMSASPVAVSPFNGAVLDPATGAVVFPEVAAPSALAEEAGVAPAVDPLQAYYAEEARLYEVINNPQTSWDAKLQARAALLQLRMATAEGWQTFPDRLTGAVRGVGGAAASAVNDPLVQQSWRNQQAASGLLTGGVTGAARGGAVSTIPIPR